MTDTSTQNPIVAFDESSDITPKIEIPDFPELGQQFNPSELDGKPMQQYTAPPVMPVPQIKESQVPFTDMLYEVPQLDFKPINLPSAPQPSSPSFENIPANFLTNDGIFKPAFQQPETEFNPLQMRFGDAGNGVLGALSYVFGAPFRLVTGLGADVGRGVATGVSGIDTVQQNLPTRVMEALRGGGIIGLGQSIINDFVTGGSIAAAATQGESGLPYSIRAMTEGRTLSFMDRGIDQKGRFNPYGYSLDKLFGVSPLDTPAERLGDTSISKIVRQQNWLNQLTSVIGAPAEFLLNIGAPADGKLEIPKFSDWLADRFTQAEKDKRNFYRSLTGFGIDAIVDSSIEHFMPSFKKAQEKVKPEKPATTVPQPDVMITPPPIKREALKPGEPPATVPDLPTAEAASSPVILQTPGSITEPPLALPRPPELPTILQDFPTIMQDVGKAYEEQILQLPKPVEVPLLPQFSGSSIGKFQDIMSRLESPRLDDMISVTTETPELVVPLQIGNVPVEMLPERYTALNGKLSAVKNFVFGDNALEVDAISPDMSPNQVVSAFKDIVANPLFADAKFVVPTSLVPESRLTRLTSLMERLGFEVSTELGYATFRNTPRLTFENLADAVVSPSVRKLQTEWRQYDKIDFLARHLDRPISFFSGVRLNKLVDIYRQIDDGIIKKELGKWTHKDFYDLVDSMRGSIVRDQFSIAEDKLTKFLDSYNIPGEFRDPIKDTLFELLYSKKKTTPEEFEQLATKLTRDQLFMRDPQVRALMEDLRKPDILQDDAAYQEVRKSLPPSLRGTSPEVRAATQLYHDSLTMLEDNLAQFVELTTQLKNLDGQLDVQNIITYTDPLAQEVYAGSRTYEPIQVGEKVYLQKERAAAAAQQIVRNPVPGIEYSEPKVHKIAPQGMVRIMPVKEYEQFIRDFNEIKDNTPTAELPQVFQRLLTGLVDRYDVLPDGTVINPARFKVTMREVLPEFETPLELRVAEYNANLDSEAAHNVVSQLKSDLEDRIDQAQSAVNQAMDRVRESRQSLEDQVKTEQPAPAKKRGRPKKTEDENVVPMSPAREAAIETANKLLKAKQLYPIDVRKAQRIIEQLKQFQDMDLVNRLEEKINPKAELKPAAVTPAPTPIPEPIPPPPPVEAAPLPIESNLPPDIAELRAKGKRISSIAESSNNGSYNGSVSFAELASVPELGISTVEEAKALMNDLERAGYIIKDTGTEAVLKKRGFSDQEIQSGIPESNGEITVGFNFVLPELARAYLGDEGIPALRKFDYEVPKLQAKKQKFQSGIQRTAHLAQSTEVNQTLKLKDSIDDPFTLPESFFKEEPSPPSSGTPINTDTVLQSFEKALDSGNTKEFFEKTLVDMQHPYAEAANIQVPDSKVGKSWMRLVDNVQEALLDGYYERIIDNFLDFRNKHTSMNEAVTRYYESVIQLATELSDDPMTSFMITDMFPNLDEIC